MNRRVLVIAAMAVASGAAAAAAIAFADVGARPGHAGSARAAAALYEPPAASRTVRIVALGDSITQGGRGAKAHPLVEGYRPSLFRMLVASGAHFDFVGSTSSAFVGSLDVPPHEGREFDADHEGHWGWTTVAIRRQLGGWLERYDADVALILLGTNDKDHAISIEETIDELRTIIAVLRADNPRIVVLLGQVFHDWWRFRWLRFRTAQLARETSTPSSPVVAVDHGHGWVSDPSAEGTLTMDWIHPNATGNARLARTWMSALAPFLARFESRAREEAPAPEGAPPALADTL